MKRIKTNSFGARVLSGLLSVVMVMSACPVTAFADYEDPETTTVVVEESETESENEKTNVVAEDGQEDENVGEIPANEDAEDQTNPDVEVPPDNEDAETPSENEVSDEDAETPSENEISDEDTETPSENEITDEDVSDGDTEDVIEEYTYKVTLPEDKNVTEGAEVSVSADIVATVTVEGETSDVDYTFEFSVNDNDNVDMKCDSTNATITFNKDGDYTVVGKMIVDGEEVASDEMKVTVEKELPIVEFDHYFTEIDESLIETSDLIITTNDSSVFTKNTNVVSNFDNAYIVSCESVQEAKYVYSYYVDKVDTISDLSKVISIATNENDEDVADLSDINSGNDALSNLNDIDVNDYSGYIALIDTGANADVNFSVVGDDTSDTNGHGTKMLNLIKAENPDAKVMSIRAFNGNKTDTASIYAAIKLAIESKVSVINLSLVGSDVEKNAIVKEAIQEAIDKNIVVIGAAGNYNISAKKFIPGCIDEAIIIGAANEDGTKYATSNTDADFYVIAESTSEATAIYTGLYTANKLDDKRIFLSDGTSSNITIDRDIDEYVKRVHELYGLENCTYSINEDGSIVFYIDIANLEQWETAAANKSSCTYDWGNIISNYVIPATGIEVGNYYDGTCNFDAGDPGAGTANAFTQGSSGDNNIFYNIWVAAGSPTINASCDSHWNDKTLSRGAKCLTDKTDMPYRATVSSYEVTDEKVLITFDILYSVDGYEQREWDDHNKSASWSVKITHKLNEGKKDTYTVTAVTNGKSKTIVSSIPDSELAVYKTEIVTWTAEELNSELETALAADSDNYEGIKDYTVSGIPTESNIVLSIDGITGNTTKTTCSGTSKSSWSSTTQQQVYHSQASAWSHRYVYLDLEKTVSGLDKVKPILDATEYYTLNGATFKVFESDGTTPAKDKDGNEVVWTISNNGRNTSWKSPLATFDYDTYNGKKLVVKETQAGRGYRWKENWTGYTKTEVTMPTVGGQTGHAYLKNIPANDPMTWAIVKISEITRRSDKDWSGDITPINAEYTVKQYLLTDTNGKGKLENTWTYKTDETGRIDFRNKSQCTSTSKPPNDPDDSTRFTWPYGYYEIQETAVSTVDGHNAGTELNSKIYTFIMWPDSGKNSTNKPSIKLMDGSTLVVSRKYDPSTNKYIPYTNDKYKIPVTDRDGNHIWTSGTDGSSLFTVEGEVWFKLGLFKADDGLVYSGHYNTNDTIKYPQGAASFKGAKYQVFVTDSVSGKFFDDTSGANGGKVLTLGAKQSMTSWTDGLGNTGTHNTSTLYPVLVDGKPLYITTNANGRGTTNVVLPQSNKYRALEVVAPTGYHISNKVEKFEGVWTSKDNGSVKVSLSSPTGTVSNTATINNNTRKGMAVDDVYDYGITGVKVDSQNVNGQGDGTTNGIRFAVINRNSTANGNGQVVLDDRNTTLDLKYCNWVNKKIIYPGQIVAILTTHTVNDVEGTFRMNGLPYGTYEVVELRHNASFKVGDTYSDTSAKAGDSIYANPSYLYDKNSTGPVDLNSETDKYMYKLRDYVASSKTEDGKYLAVNDVFVDGFYAWKLDKTDLNVTEGHSSANDIRFAIVNRSARQVRLEKKYVDLIGTDADYVDYKAHEAIAPGQVVAILTTHDKTLNGRLIDGYMSIYGLPYGTYAVYELKRDASIEVGDVYNNSTKLGTSIFANDSYYFNPIAQPLDFTDTYGTTGTEHACTLADSFARHNFKHNDGNSPFQDEVFRDGFSFWKRDLTFHKLDSHPQGDSTFNGIRYAVVNRSNKEVVLLDQYNTVETNYSKIVDGQKIQPGQVAAILTSHQKNNLEGYVAMAGLPYGEYDIYELRADATIAIGDVYNGSNKLGTSIYANAYPDMNPVNKNTHTYPSMLFDSTLQTNPYFHYTLTDTTDDLTVKYDPNHIHEVDDNGVAVCMDETVYGTLKIVKYDRETAQTGVDGNQGVNTFKGIRYAVVNRSERAVSYPYEDDSDDAYYKPGEIIAIVELDETATATLDHMCYGSYDVYELRWDSTLEPHDDYDTSTDKYGTDHRANAWYCYNDDINQVRITNNDLQVIEVTYEVAPQEGDTIRVQDEQNLHEYYDLPIRADFQTTKVNIDGKRMSRIPFLVSLVRTDENGEPIKNEDGTYQVVEEHIIVTDDRGEINTRNFVKRPKTADNINKLDGLYSGVDFTGTKQQLIDAATQNIWFGDIDEYQTQDQYLVNKRGSLLAGTYILQELRLNPEYGFEEGKDENGIDWSTMKYDMISSRIIVTEDNVLYDPFDFDIGVDIGPIMKSVALDMKSKSDAFVPDEASELQDTIEFGNLNSTQKYGFKSTLWRVKEDGTKEVLYEDDAVIPIDFDKLLELTDGKLQGATVYYDDVTGEWSVLKTIANAEPVFRVVHDFNVQRDVTVDTSMCQEGEYVAFSVDLYKMVGAQGWSWLMDHNENCLEPTQKIGVIALNTLTVNKTTGNRIGSLGGYEYSTSLNGVSYNEARKDIPLTDTNSFVYNKDGQIIGYTLVDDKVTWKNLADNHNYRMRVELVDDNNNPIVDIYGNTCISNVIGLYSSEEISEIKEVISTDTHGNVIERHFDVPRDGELNFSDIGLMDWIIPNNTTVHVNVILMDGRGPILKIHNKDFDVEEENIRWLDIKTTAMSEDGAQGVLPNGKHWDENGHVVYEDVVLRDKIDYTNCAEATTVRVEGYVYLVDYAEDGTRSIAMDKNGEPIVVSYNSNKFDITSGAGSVEMQYTVKFGELAEKGINLDGRDLVVCERVFMDVNHKYTRNEDGTLTRETGDFEVLVALHENINDEMQTVSIPDIKTTAVNAHNGSKTFSRIYADVTVNDTVYYTNLKPGTTWNLTAVLYDKKTGEPVRDMYGKIAQNTIEFIPETKDGSVVVPITFKQVLTSLDWEDDPSWVCFETLRNGTKGSSDLKYAVHNNLHDNDQTVHLPTFRTFAESESTTEPKFINAAPGQIVMDKVEVKNLGLNAIKDEEGNVTGYEPQKFTLKIEAVDAETGEYLLDSKGEVISNTKTFTFDGTKGKMVYHEHEDVDIECDVVKFDFVGSDALQIPITIDGTKLAGKTIVFYETLYFGEECVDGEEVLIENNKDNVDQQVTVLEKPEIGTKLLDRLTEDVTVAYGQKVELVDTVSYKNLLTGVEYKIEGILMDKDTGKPALDKNGKEITSEATFTPKETDPREGTVDVVFTVDTTRLAGHTLVAYETCYELGSNKFDIEHGKTYIAEHTELEDANQTVYVLKIGTTAKDKVDGDHALDGTKTTQTIVDTVKYENLVVGKEYTVTGKLALAGTNPVEYVTDANGNVVTVTKKFTAEAPSDNPDAKTVSGTIDVEFTFDASRYAGRRVVVFEDVYYNGIKIATHSNINDENQSLDISLLLHVAVQKSDFNNHSYMLKNAEITIYSDKECTTIAKDVNGKDCVGLTGEDGMVHFTILTYDVNSVFYAKETKAPFGYKINEDVFEVHPTTDRSKDESAGQCLINIQILDKIIVIPPKTGDNLPILPIVIFSLIGLLCIGAFFALKPKKVLADSDSDTAAEADVEDTNEDKESVVAMMAEDIDGNIGDTGGNDGDTGGNDGDTDGTSEFNN